MKALDLTNQTIGQLKVIKQVANHGKRRQYLCQCSCGNYREIVVDNLRSGNSTNCGCVRREKITARNFKHGLAKNHELYGMWTNMHNRCNNSNHGDYYLYGAKGVKVCERWNDFEVFISDMGERPKDHSIDRYPNPYGNYEPANCRWASAFEQRHNQRTTL